MRPLDGTRVVDFGRYVAGPWCAQLLQGFGADVLRVERPGGAEDRPLFPLGAEGVGAFLVHANRGKRSMTLNPTSDGGREVVRRLIASADVIIANLPDESLVALGLDWDAVSTINPRTVLATATTFGTTGPYAGRLGFDGIGQAMSGATYMAGSDTAPAKAFAPWVDYQTATTLALAVVTALLDRETTGVGARVEADLLGAGMVATGHVLLEEASEHLDRPPAGNRHPAAGPSDVVATSDGHVQVQVVGNAMFQRWCALVDRPQLADDPRFATDASRGEHGAELSAIFTQWCSTRTRDEVRMAMAAAGVPSGPVLAPREVIADPHVQTVLEAVRVEGVDGSLPVVPHPVRAGGARSALGAEMAALGAHTEEVLVELGYSPGEIEHLRETGAV